MKTNGLTISAEIKEIRIYFLKVATKYIQYNIPQV